MAKVTRKPGATGSINITELVLKQPNRSNIDIKKWRTAIQSAESVTSPRRRDLLDLYDDLMLDGHLISVIEKRKRGIKGLPITFLKDGTPVDEVINFLDTQAFGEMLADLNDAKFYGHSLVQIDFTGEKLTYELIPRKHVKPESGLVILNESDTTGTDFRSEPEVNYILESGGKKNLGKLMPAAQYVIWKRGGFGDWAELAELFGRPLRKGKYNPNDTAGKAALLAMLESLGGAPYIAYPEGTEVEVDAAGSNLTGDIYDLLKNACNAEISKIFLGSTLTTEAGTKGARSLGEVHERGEHDVFKDDRKDILSLLNNVFLKLLEKHGFPVTGGIFTYQDTEELSRMDQLDMIKKIKDMGLPVSDDYIYETFDIPKPDDYVKPTPQVVATPVNPYMIKILKDMGVPIDDDFIYQQFGISKPAGYDKMKSDNAAAKVAADTAAADAKKILPGKEKKAKVVADPAQPPQPTASFIDSMTGFFSSLMGKADPIDAFSLKAQNEARRIAKMIYDNTLPDGFTVDEGMVNLISEYLIKAIEAGYGKISATVTESSRRALGEKLIKNAYKFSAAKTEAMQRDMQALMIGADGNPLAQAKFLKVVDSLNVQYNKTWTRTEWNTSTSCGQMAEKWQGYLEDADIMPFLEFITVGDDRVRDDHAVLNGIIRPVDDPFWDTYTPPIDWNDRCDVIQVTDPDAKPTDLSAMSLPSIQDQFANNPGKTGEIFNKFNATIAGASDAAKSKGEDLAQQYIDEL